MQEIIDIFDGNYDHIGQFERRAAEKQGLWHHTFHCWIVSNRGDTGTVVLQLRSQSKKNYPNMLDITAAGHLQAGESPIDGLREIEEELGTRPTAESLVPLGIKHDVMDEPGGVRNREFSHVYLLRDDRSLEQYTLDESEVTGLVDMPIGPGLRLFSNEIDHVDCAAIRLENGTKESFHRNVAVVDLIPRVDAYYLKVFIMAQLLLDGKKYLSI